MWPVKCPFTSSLSSPNLVLHPPVPAALMISISPCKGTLVGLARLDLAHRVLYRLPFLERVSSEPSTVGVVALYGFAFMWLLLDPNL